MKAANEKVANLTSSSSRFPIVDVPGVAPVFRVATTCAEIIEYAEKLAEVASNSPASPKVTTYAEKITGAGSITCSETEITNLKSAQTSLTAAADRIDSALMAVQEQIMSNNNSNTQTLVIFPLFSALTGSTASSSMLTGVSTRATRRRNFRF